MRILSFLLIAVTLFSCSASNIAKAEGAGSAGTVVQSGAPLRTVKVSNASELVKALRNARPGDEIEMADGTYAGKFKIEAGADGTAKNPIMLKGNANVILDAGDISTGYVLSLKASYWHLKDFALTNGLKGLVTDSASHCVIDGLQVYHIGEEGIHLRTFSSNNVVKKCMVNNTGLKTPDYGEGIYIGSARSNWKRYTADKPDKSDNNVIENNLIGPNVTAECIDVKEGTTGGVIRGNIFDAAGISGEHFADSWIDLKGNNYVIENNIGKNPDGEFFKDGYQVHAAAEGWGNNNVFSNNTSEVNADGYGFNIQLKGSNGACKGNIIYSDNIVKGAAKGVSNIEVTKK